MKTFSLGGRVAIVTGGNGGLGLAMAKALAQAGASVMIAARSQQKVIAPLGELQAEGLACDFTSLDVRSAQSCEAAIKTTLARFGRLDILINNAGMSVRRAPQDLTEEQWHEVLDVNLSGAFRCARAAYPHMKAAGGGKIVNVGSMYSLFGAPMVAAYAASKGGLVQLTKSLACAWAADNIQVNAILPGWLDTDLTRAARQQVDGLDQAVLARTPAARWGVPEDVAGAALFLSAPASDFVTGTQIPVDGGYSARG